MNTLSQVFGAFFMFAVIISNLMAYQWGKYGSLKKAWHSIWDDGKWI